MTQPMTPREKVDLKPCPFCGGEPSVSTYETESLWSHDIVTYTEIGCGECDVHFATEPGYELEAPAAWNRRTALASGSGDPISLQKVQTNAGDPDLQKMQFGGGDYAELAKWIEDYENDAALDAAEDGDLSHVDDGLREFPLQRVKALIAENAALRDMVEKTANLSMEQTERLLAMHDRATEAERKLAEANDESTRWALRFADVREAAGLGVKPMLDDVPVALRAMRGRLAEARGLLEPFAAMADVGDQRPGDDAVWAGQSGVALRYGHFRAARTFLSSTEAERG